MKTHPRLAKKSTYITIKKTDESFLMKSVQKLVGTSVCWCIKSYKSRNWQTDIHIYHIWCLSPTSTIVPWGSVRKKNNIIVINVNRWRCSYRFIWNFGKWKKIFWYSEKLPWGRIKWWDLKLYFRIFADDSKISH